MNNDKKIKDVLKKIAERKKSLGPKPSMVLRSNGICKINDDEHTNLNVLTSLEVCVRLYAKILEKEYFQFRAMSELGVDESEVPVLAQSYEWKQDLITKAASIRWRNEEKKLKKLENQLKDLRSNDAKTSDLIDELKDLL